jgi:hypothetical protein
MSFVDNMFRFNYSRDLHEYLKGMSLDCEGYTRQSTYQLIALAMLGFSTVVVLNYYYGIFNRPIFSRIKTWSANVLMTSTIIAFAAYTLAAVGLPQGMHCSYLHFYKTDCVLFGLTAFVYNTLFCIALSSCVKWLSVNNKKVPF